MTHLDGLGPCGPFLHKIGSSGARVGPNGGLVLQLVLHDVRNERVRRIGRALRVYLRNKVLWGPVDDLRRVCSRVQADYATYDGRHFGPFAGYTNTHSFNQQPALLSRPD